MWRRLNGSMHIGQHIGRGFCQLWKITLNSFFHRLIELCQTDASLFKTDDKFEKRRSIDMEIPKTRQMPSKER